MLNRLRELVQTFLFDPINKRMEVKQPIKFDSTVSFSDAALEAGDIAVADGKIIIGGAAGKGIAQTPSGDVTITNAGVTAIGAKKVLKGMMSLAAGKVFAGKKTSNDAEEIDISAEGAIVIGQGAGETPAAAILSGDVTMAKTGAITVGADKILKAMVKDYDLDYSNIALANGKILVGDGSGHAVEQALGTDATLLATKVTLTAAQIKALATTAIEIVPAPGANKVVELATALLRLNNGTEVLVEVDDNMAFRYVDAAGVICSQTIECTGFIDQAAVTYTNAKNKINVIGTVAQLVNKAIVLHNINDNFTGNATGDATLDVWVHYRVYTIA